MEGLFVFLTHENRHNPHVTIYEDGCGQLRKHGGEHKYNQGEYKNVSKSLRQNQMRITLSEQDS